MNNYNQIRKLAEMLGSKWWRKEELKRLYKAYHKCHGPENSASAAMRLAGQNSPMRGLKDSNETSKLNFSLSYADIFSFPSMLCKHDTRNVVSILFQLTLILQRVHDH